MQNVEELAGEALGLRRIVLHADAPHHFLRADDADTGLKAVPAPGDRGIAAHPALGRGIVLRHVSLQKPAARIPLSDSGMAANDIRTVQWTSRTIATITSDMLTRQRAVAGTLAWLPGMAVLSLARAAASIITARPT